MTSVESSGQASLDQASDRSLACPVIAPTLRACERSFDRSDGEIGPAPSGIQAISDVRAHLHTCPTCATRHGRRLAALEARQALVERELPVDSFEGFFEEIRERVPFTAPGGGMSAAFLDAPRSLRIWRSAAVAASLILALGVGFAATGGLGITGGEGRAGVRPLHDPRDHLLPSFDASSATWPATQSGFLLRPVHAPITRGHEAFFEPATPEPIYLEGDGFREGNGRLEQGGRGDPDEGERDVRLR